MSIKGISCVKCVAKIESLVGRMDGLERLRVSMATGIAEVEVNRKTGSMAGVAKAIENLGFQVTPIQNETNEQIARSVTKDELLRLGIAGFCTSNIMMFSFAIYAGASPEFFAFFKWLNFFLYLPILFFVARPFYAGALRSLRQGSLSIDLPLTVASVSGFLFSTVNLIRNQGSLYFDSLSGFLSLILLSRYVQKKLLMTTVDIGSGSQLNVLAMAKKKLADGSWIWKPIAQIAVGDIVVLSRGESVPVDGVVEGQQIVVSTAVLTGESRLQTLFPGMRALAGSLLASNQASIQVEKTGSQTELGKLLLEIEKRSVNKNQLQNLSDRWSQILIKVVFSLAALFLVSYWHINPEEALERSLALLILACPCAMAFGTPLAIAFGLKRSRQSGFLVKSPDVFEKISKVTNVFLDKTGTLTSSAVTVLRTEPSVLSEDDARAILALEAESHHPIAVGLREFIASQFTTNLTPLPMTDIVEKPGYGVYGSLDTELFSVKSAEKVSEEKAIGLFVNGKLKIKFILSNSIVLGATHMVDQLKHMGKEVKLLSGDQRQFVEEAAVPLHLKNQDCFFELTPQRKAEMIAKFPMGRMMVGDGVNDSLAMSEAEVGVAVRGAVEQAIKSADVYFFSNDLSKIPDLFSLSTGTLKMIRSNLWLALIYNLLAGTASLIGWVNPLVAAIAMPITSGLILLNTSLQAKWRWGR